MLPIFSQKPENGNLESILAERLEQRSVFDFQKPFCLFNVMFVGPWGMNVRWFSNKKTSCNQTQENSFFFRKNRQLLILKILWEVSSGSESVKLLVRELNFGIKIRCGTIPSGFPVFCVIVPVCSRNSYGASTNLRVQKKFVKFRQSTQNPWLCPAKFLRQFFWWPSLLFPQTLGWCTLQKQCVLRLGVSSIFLCISRNGCYLPLVP